MKNISVPFMVHNMVMRKTIIPIKQSFLYIMVYKYHFIKYVIINQNLVMQALIFQYYV